MPLVMCIVSVADKRGEIANSSCHIGTSFKQLPYLQRSPKERFFTDEIKQKLEYCSSNLCSRIPCCPSDGYSRAQRHNTRAVYNITCSTFGFCFALSTTLNKIHNIGALRVTADKQKQPPNISTNNSSIITGNKGVKGLKTHRLILVDLG